MEKNWYTLSKPKRWLKFGPPFRPSKDDLRVYLCYLKKIFPQNVLILGATPELRDLCAKMRLKVFIMDYSTNMMMAMSRLLKTAEIYNEIWIKCNWLEESPLSNSFDAIVGDLSLRNVPFHLQKKMLKRVSEMIKPHGYVILREHILNRKVLDFKFAGIITSVFKNYQFKPEKEIEDLITSRLFDAATDMKRHTTKKRKFFKNTKNYLLERKKELTDRQIIILESILEKWRNSVVWTQRTSEEMEDLFKKDFKLIEKRTSKDYEDSVYYPTYLLKKNIICR